MKFYSRPLRELDLETLPNLNGSSEAQASYAANIRLQTLQDFDSWLRFWEQRPGQTPAAAWKCRENVVSHIVAEHTDACWWLDNRDTTHIVRDELRVHADAKLKETS